MKNVVFILSGIFLSLLPTSKENNPNNIEELNCDQSYTIDGGPGCIYNGTTHGWCSEEEFKDYADNVYATEDCEAPVREPEKEIKSDA